LKNKKENGSYYTPAFIAKFILDHVSDKLCDKKEIKILEPSVGDGEFVRALNQESLSKYWNSLSFTAIEKDSEEIRKAVDASSMLQREGVKFDFISGDFLSWQPDCIDKYSLITGNPPYIKKSLLSQTQIEYCRNIHSAAGLSLSTVKNIWSAFVIRCSQLLTDDGILAFVLPAEFLQVKFTSPLRDFLKNQFDRIEIFTFDELLFDSIGQDTIILICINSSKSPGIYFSHIKESIQLLTNSFKLSQNKALIDAHIKWTHHELLSDEIDFIIKIKEKLFSIDSYCVSRPGVVTAANEFFIINKDTEQEFNLNSYTVPIIQRGSHVNGSVIFNETDLQKLIQSGLPSKLLCFPENMISSFPKGVKKYINAGVKKNIPLRYKCKNRNKWYSISELQKPYEGCFFKRSHLYPKLIKNTSNALVTDSAYGIYMKNNHEIEGLIFSFYNSFTLLFAEIEGRYYGGGVLELTPNEFKNLPLPWTSISKTNFTSYCKAFEEKSTIEDVLKINDLQILTNTLKLDSFDIEKVQSIRSKIISKRLRNRL
jgi:adenine-specific DNA-methyltransferase